MHRIIGYVAAYERVGCRKGNRFDTRAQILSATKRAAFQQIAFFKKAVIVVVEGCGNVESEVMHYGFWGLWVNNATLPQIYPQNFVLGKLL